MPVSDSKLAAMLDILRAERSSIGDRLRAVVITKRYQVRREEAAISGTFYAPIWYVLRTAFRVVRRRDVAYHAVPSAFARRRELADEFAAAWKRWVGGGDLVYTRSPAGMEILMRERVSLRRAVRAATFEEWR